MRILILLITLFLFSCSEENNIIPTTDYQVTNRTLNCTPPDNVSVTNVSTNNVSLKWNKKVSASKYRVEWTSLASGVWIYRDVLDTTYTIPGLSVGFTYRVRVKSLCQGWVNGVFYGESSAPTSEIEVTTINNTPLCIDMYEYNNSSGVSKPIIFSKPLNAKISKPQIFTDRKGKTTITPDFDWFSFYTSTKFMVDLYDLPENYDMEVYRTVNNSSKNIILVSSSKNGGKLSEKITVNDFMQYERYYIRVFGNTNMIHNDTICYKLRISTIP